MRRGPNLQGLLVLLESTRLICTTLPAMVAAGPTCQTGLNLKRKVVVGKCSDSLNALDES